MVQFIAMQLIRVSAGQVSKVDWKKVMKHVRDLERSEDDLFPINVRPLHDGTFVIAGNGRHRFFAYQHLAYTHIPAFIGIIIGYFHRLFGWLSRSSSPASGAFKIIDKYYN